MITAHKVINHLKTRKVFRKWYEERFGRAITNEEAEAIFLALAKAYNNGETKINKGSGK